MNQLISRWTKKKKKLYKEEKKKKIKTTEKKEEGQPILLEQIFGYIVQEVPDFEDI